jgi:hypothetical protein
MNQDAGNQRQTHLTELLDNLVPLGVRLRLNRNRRVLLSLRQQPSGRTVLSLHEDLLDHVHALAEIPAWIRSRGRLHFPAMRDALSRVWRDQHMRQAPPPPDLPVLEGPLDLDALLDRLHCRWFAHLSRPAIRWSRASPRRRLRHIRFGCYRKGPPAEILINPRLGRPWVAMAFIEHVVFHELCHHAQASMPIRGESAHSRRFRELERTYPHHAASLAWERAWLHRLLAGDEGG